jgi:glycosyltransferase involved in cell wall biosynthesis
MKRVVILANPSSGYMVGGAENQLIQLGIELSQKKVQVTLIGTIDHHSENDPFDYKRINGNWARPAGLWQLFKTIREINPDTFVTRVLNPLLPIYGLMCLLLGTKLYYFCAHDWEVESRPDKRISGWRWRSFWLGIHFVDKLFVQNSYQLEGFRGLLKWGKGRVNIIRNIPLMEPVHKVVESQKVFTWIGSYRAHKRPEWMIELAKNLPALKFEVVVDVKANTEVGEKFITADKDLNNFTYIAGAARDELAEIYKRSQAILITSEGEGFPNVAIEAWSQGRPIISTVNNALLDLEDNRAVTIAQDIEDFISVLSKTDEKCWEEFGQTGLNLFKKEFSKDTIINQLFSYSK